MAEIFWPFDPSLINYGFGNAPGYGGFHNGIDFAVPQSTPLIATASGTIRNNDAGQVDGAGVDITTPDGWKVRMWHVSAFLVPNGSWVEAGQVVALSGGARGSWGAGNATGPHLHWGVLIGTNWVDPTSLNPKMFQQPKKKEEEEMRVIRSEDGRVALVGEFYAYQYANQAEIEWNAGVHTKTFGDTVGLTPAEFDTLISDARIRRDQFIRAIGNGGTPAPDTTTKAEILEAIEANYPEDKL